MNPGFLQQLVFDLFIIGLFAIGIYSFLIAPRQREFRRREKLVQTLKVGSEVLTYGGMIGTVKSIADTGIVTVEVAPGVEVRFVAAAITQEFDLQAYSESARRHMKPDK